MKTFIEKYENSKFITVQIDKKFEVVLCTMGASLFAVKLNGEYMTQTHVDKSIYLKQYYGKTVGRVANRLPGNIIKINNKEYVLENNEGPNVLHGGVHGFSKQNFDFEITELKNQTKVVFSYLSPDLESGFPGNMKIIVTYRLFKSHTVKMEYLAETDKKTMCNLTNHAYYSLGSDNLHNEFRIKSSRFLHPNPADLLPIEIRKVDEIMDFRNFKVIGKDVDNPYLINSKTKGYDHFYYFDKKDPKIVQATLRNSKYLMNVKTDFEGLQIYSDNGVSETKFEGTELTSRRGLAIEPSESQKDIHYLNPGEIYSRFITLEFKERK